MENESYSADNKGLRHDEGKTQFHLIPSDGLAELARVYMFGAKKYAPYNWERGMAHSRVFNALLRHLYAYWDGEARDQETGLHHMAHVAWNAIALLVYSLRGIGEDDRKASLISAQQNNESAKWKLGEGPQVFWKNHVLDDITKRRLEENKAMLADPMQRITNPYGLDKRIDLKEQQPAKICCYNCANDALPHHVVCQECLAKIEPKLRSAT